MYKQNPLAGVNKRKAEWNLLGNMWSSKQGSDRLLKIKHDWSS